MSRSEYVIVAFLDNFKKGDKLLDWPLHVTIVPWCAFYDLNQFRTDAKKIVKNMRPLKVTVGERRIWGPNTVNMIDYSIPLHRLHEQLLELAKSSGRILINEQYTGRNFTPHVTHQKNKSAAPGRLLHIDTLYLVEKDMNQRLKTVVAKIKLA